MKYRNQELIELTDPQIFNPPKMMCLWNDGFTDADIHVHYVSAIICYDEGHCVYSNETDVIYTTTKAVTRQGNFYQHCAELPPTLSENKMYWHPYKDCTDAPKVAEHQAKSFLCKVQRFNKDTREEIGFASYQVCICDDNGMFYGMRGSAGQCVAEVIAWTDIVES